MDLTSKATQEKKNKNAFITRKIDRSHNNGALMTIAQAPGSVKRKTVTTDCIEIDTGDDDSDSNVLFLERVVEVFSECVTLYDFGNTVVYLNPWEDFRYDIENTAHERQIDMVYLYDVYSKYKTFLLYHSKHGKVRILPDNQDFHTIFKRLRRKKNNTLAPRMIVRLTDINQKAQRCKSKYDQRDPEYHHFSDEGSDNFDTKITLKSEKEFEFENIIPLTNTRDKIHSKLLKVNTSATPSVPPLPWIPPSFPCYRVELLYPVEEQLQYPMQVSDEQRDDRLTHTEQVVSDSHSTTFYGSSFHYGVGVSQARNDAQASVSALSRPRVPPRYPNYSEYADRILSFRTWIHTSPDDARLSQAGFFFTNEEDLVRCFQCGIGLKDFSSEDDPLLEHVRHSGKCPFLPELLGEDRLEIYKNRLQAEDPEYNRRQQWANIQNGSAPRSSYKHPQYQTLQSRISTFAGWPQSMSQTPRQLAEAGLFYTGTEDQVRCFACDGGLRRWDPEDDPWTEHCRWFPACPFALEQKGQQYIALIQASVENERYGASGGGEQDLTNAMEQMNLRESEIETVLRQHKDVCLEMGYEEKDIKSAVQELIERGNDQRSLEDIIVLIDVIRERKRANIQSTANESLFDENKRLKRIVYCMMCGKNNVNALFLPCTHHEVCMECADPLETCPVCHRRIREKIRTYMA